MLTASLANKDTGGRAVFPSVLAALAAAVSAGAAAAAHTHASAKAGSAAQIEVFSPRTGDVAGKQSKGFLVDLAVRYPSLAASGADFQLTGPTVHQNQAPFRARSRRASTRSFPG